MNSSIQSILHNYVFHNIHTKMEMCQVELLPQKFLNINDTLKKELGYFVHITPPTSSYFN